MIWLHPVAWLGLAGLLAPILIHLLVHKRADAVLFPTLRFVQPTRLAAIRRRFLDALPLLLIRAAVLAATTAAIAGPVLVTASRRAVWNARVARAVIIDDETSRSRAQQELVHVFRGVVIHAPTISEGLQRAVAWLDDQPIGKREIVAMSRFPLTALGEAAVMAVPAHIGLRFVRIGSLAPSATADAQSIFGPSDAAGRVRVTPRDILLTGAETQVFYRAPHEAEAPIEIDAPVEARPVIDAALGAVLSESVLAAAPHRLARLVFVGAQTFADTVAGATPIRQAWMADAVAAIARDAEFLAAARALAVGLDDRRFTRPPWQPLSDAAQPLAAAAAFGDRLLIVSASPPLDVSTPILLRATFNSLAPHELDAQVEVIPISDAQLNAWTRPSSPLQSADVRRIEDDDRRWLWAAALVLLGLEEWMRRSADVADVADVVA
jgi:hypothetical protein